MRRCGLMPAGALLVLRTFNTRILPTGGSRAAAFSIRSHAPCNCVSEFVGSLERIDIYKLFLSEDSIRAIRVFDLTTMEELYA